MEMVDLQSVPTHFADANGTSADRARQLAQVLDGMERLLREVRSELLIPLVDRVMELLSFLPDFTYQDVALSLQGDHRFQFQGGLVSAAGEDDPWGAFRRQVQRRAERN